MDNFIIREAISTDFTLIGELYKQVDRMHHEALPKLFKSSSEIERLESYFEEILKNQNSSFLVALLNERIVGFIQLEIKDTNHPLIQSYKFGHISELVINDELKRKGIGKSLLTESHKWFQLHGITEVNLMVFDFNKEAIAFYRNLGYVNKHITMTTLLTTNENT